MDKRQGVIPFKRGGSRRGDDPQATFQETGHTLADHCNSVSTWKEISFQKDILPFERNFGWKLSLEGNQEEIWHSERKKGKF